MVEMQYCNSADRICRSPAHGGTPLRASVSVRLHVCSNWSRIRRRAGTPVECASPVHGSRDPIRRTREIKQCYAHMGGGLKKAHSDPVAVGRGVGERAAENGHRQKKTRTIRRVPIPPIFQLKQCNRDERRANAH